MHDGVLAKRLGAGFAARAAVLAAFLAKDGLTGTRRTLEGDVGLFALYARGEVMPDRLLEDWGRRWEIPEYSLKPYPGCRCNHTAIGLGIRLHREGVRAEQIAGIEIGLGNVNWLTVGQPYDPSLKSVVHAQFNAAYSFARALLDGKVDLAAYEPDAVGDPRVLALTAITRVIDDPAIDARAIAPARVALRLKNGRDVDVSSATIKGGPEEPMSDMELEKNCSDASPSAWAPQRHRPAASSKPCVPSSTHLTPRTRCSTPSPFSKASSEPRRAARAPHAPFPARRPACN